MNIVTVAFELLSLSFCALAIIAFVGVSWKSLENIKSTFKNNWIFFAAILVILFQLITVHLSYSGLAQTINGHETVSHSPYVYPFFSDEWVEVSLIKYSIAHHALPLVNPLDHDQPFSNILFVFPSVMAQIFIVTGLNPLTQWYAMAIFFGLFLCASIYILLKKYGVNSYIAAAAMLMVPWIANAGDLPALWSLLPFTFATIFLFWQMIAQKSDSKFFALVFAVLALAVYPPIVVFVIPVLCAGWLTDEGWKKSLIRVLTILGICILVFAVIFLIVIAPFHTPLSAALAKYLIRPNLDPGIISYGIWNVMPFFVPLFAIVGAYIAFKKKYFDLLSTAGIGIIFWCVYAFVNKVFIIEYPRIVVITSLFLIILAGIGCDWLIRKYVTKNTEKTLCAVGIIAVLVSLALLPSYTTGTSWQKLGITLPDGQGGYETLVPAPAVNRYLTPDDIRLFSNIPGIGISTQVKGRAGIAFVAPPWKGLVIGAAMHDFPLETKPSIITIAALPYAAFMDLDCAGKLSTADHFRIQYVYSSAFSCPQFMEMGSSTEGLHLYSYVQ